ncbi:hypothetical protein ACLKA6_007202 [Drosophila palustris]
MLLFALLSRCILVALSLPTRSPQSLGILRARDACSASGKLNPEQRRALDRQEYENELWVHLYIHCFWTQLQLWEDDTGFNSNRILHTYGGRQRLNEEEALLAINGCNARARGTSEYPIDWCFKAFICILRTPVGDWYRRYMLDVINGNV